MTARVQAHGRIETMTMLHTTNMCFTVDPREAPLEVHLRIGMRRGARRSLEVPQVPGGGSGKSREDDERQFRSAGGIAIKLMSEGSVSCIACGVVVCVAGDRSI